MNRPHIVFLSYPSLGILDNWLPVLWELRQRRPDVHITALLPRPRLLAEIDLDDVVVRLGERVFDEVVYKSRSGFWAVAESFAQTKKRSERARAVSSVIGSIRALFWHLGTGAFLRPVAAAFDMLARRLGSLLGGERYVDLSELGRGTSALCFDLFALTKADGREIVGHFRNAACFSLLHGLAVFGEEDGWDRTRVAARPPRIRAYLHSKHERAGYSNTYGLTDDEMKVVGVPRHERRWIETILRESKSDVPESWERFIFLISRPANSDFFLKAEKRQAIEDIRKLAFEELRCKIVVKVHPTERVPKNSDAALFAEILGAQSYGKEWVYSSTHAFALGSRCLLAVAFHSGVAVDMLAIGVPVIERLNLGRESGLSEDTRALTKRYRHRGLVLPAENYDELKRHALAIMNDKAAVMQRLRSQYDEFFGCDGCDPIRAIADDIEGAL